MTSRTYPARLLGSLIEQMLARGHRVQFRAEGASMHPTIRDGESIAIAPVDAADIVAGDVVLFRHDARLLAHRVVRVTSCGAERMFELRGDAKSASDAPVPSDAVIGRVVGVARNGRVIAVTGGAAQARRTLDAVVRKAMACAGSCATVLGARRRLVWSAAFGDSVYHPVPVPIGRSDSMRGRRTGGR
jgi:signal peptidase I